MAETLLTPSSIKMYGRVLSSLTFFNDTTAIGNNNFLQRQFGTAVAVVTTSISAAGLVTLPAANTGILSGMLATSPGVIPGGTFVLPAVASNPTGTPIATATFNLTNGLSAAVTAVPLLLTLSFFARIYGFSFEGAFYSMPKPALFLVSGPGVPVDAATRRTSMDESGVVAREWEFSGKPGGGGGTDLFFWEYEKGDFSLRLDIDAGQFEQLLLAASLRAGGDRADRSGAGVSGAGVSGAGVSGAGVSGAGVSGAGVSGAGVRR